jgi:SAM-dependent methyltransferase
VDAAMLIRSVARAVLPRPVRQSLILAKRSTMAELARLKSRILLDEEVKYESQIARFYVEHLARLGIDPQGSTIVELGTGPYPAAALVLASRGATVTMVEPNFHEWRPIRHRIFLRRFLSAWGAPLAAVDQSLAAGKLSIRCLSSRAERIAGLADDSIDLVLSNAALEHVDDLPAVCRELYRITRPGGINSHQIDFRDHRDFGRPLEFLTADGPIAWKHKLYETECGSRLRCSQYLEAFIASGFRVENVHVDTLAEETYLRDFLPRLRASRSAYGEWPEEDLRKLGARFILRKPCDRSTSS